ncbi:hypothetical protein DFAR_810014 [Desulfarculales bacterium]
MVCDMSPAFLTAIGESFPGANVTVDMVHHRLTAQGNTALDQKGRLMYRPLNGASPTSPDMP